MNTFGIINHIEERLEYLKFLESDLRERSAYLPKDNFYCINSKGRTMYYTLTNSNRKYISKNDTELLKKLERKDYYTKILKEAKIETDYLNKALSQLRKCPDTDSVFVKIKSERKHLIEPYIQNLNKKSLEKWQNDYLTHRNIADNSCFVTNNGTRVRSKSELIIAERFEKYGIPYKYECSIFIGDKDVWFPDFKVVNKRTGKVFIWEHFGIMDNPEYCASTQYKIEKYAKEGYINGKNLLMTMESSNHSLNTKYVDTLIENYLL